nr:MAG: excisionase [Pseudomonadota bacterium]
MAEQQRRLITLEAWARARYAEGGPSRWTLRKWAREGKIYPHPEKHGRSYYVREDARYVGDYNGPAFMEALRESTAT